MRYGTKQAWICVAALSVALGGLGDIGAIGSARAEDPAAPAAPAENPFTALAARLDVGTAVTLEGAVLFPLRLPPGLQPGLSATVGLFGAPTEIQPLPGPAGTWHVRVANRSPGALLVPTGEGLLTPSGPSRVTDRPVWILPGAATIVPVVQSTTLPPPGPYLSRGRGLTPIERGRIHRDTWVQRVRERNLFCGVDAHRIDDVAAAYQTTLFQEAAEPLRPRLENFADGKAVVGVLVADDRGIVFGHVETDAARFRALWPSLSDGIVLDALQLAAAGTAPLPAKDPQHAAMRQAFLRVLRSTPLRRPTFGEGWEYRWHVGGHDENRWEGLAIPAGPVSLTLHRDPPRPVARPTPVPPPTAAGRGSNPTSTPGRFEGQGRARETEYERRLRERREAAEERNGRPRVDPGATRPPPPQVPTPRAPSPAPQAPPGVPAPGVPGPR